MKAKKTKDKATPRERIDVFYPEIKTVISKNGQRIELTTDDILRLMECLIYDGWIGLFVDGYKVPVTVFNREELEVWKDGEHFIIIGLREEDQPQRK